MHRSWLFRGLIISFVLLASWQTTATLRAGIGRDESIIRSATDAPSTVSIASTQRSRLPVRSQSFVYRLFLPMAPDVPPVVLAPILFSDDFSNPSSGWPVADDGNVLRGYNNGEYQILIRQSGWVYAATPGVSGTNVQIDVDLRYPQGGTGAAGIAFDISNDFSSYYALYLDPSSYQIGLFKLANGTWTNLSGWLYSPTIHPGSATNHITVVRNGSTIAPSVNGGAVPAPDDSSYTSGRVGLTAETFSNSSNADARFDNYVVTGIVTPSPTSSPAPTSTPQPTPTIIASQASEAVTYQINIAHNGVLSDGTLTLPLAQRWSVNLGGQVSYPVIALGKVFVIVANSPGYGNRLYALDAATGQVAWGPIPIPGTYWSATAAYDAGNLFVVNEDGLLQSFDAQTGTFRWSQQLTSNVGFGTPPVAVQGTVYVEGGGGYIYAVDELFGGLRWKTVVNSDSAPTLSDDGVFHTGSCHYVYKFARVTGATLWGSADPACVGGGGTISPYYAGRLYDYGYNSPYPSPGAIFDAMNGARLGTFTSSQLPTFVGNTGFYLNGASLQATDLTSGSVLWSFSGDGSLVTAPIAINSQVFIGSSSGNLYALDPSTGQIVWNTNVGASIPNPIFAYSGPLPGLNAGDGLVAVPAGNVLVAYAGTSGGPFKGQDRSR